MYLKEINATGFKSFADKITIGLDDKITCVVGPNGSGKSNVVDAVRWVLGEQSVKSLRGDGSMTDIIFSGSKSRNPLNVASVSLTFDNSDNYLNLPYNEITVKRRVYRTGENEYFLNGEKCRLKDITDLFMDSGIGKESFNIISQGEVQKILSNSPYDRRVIFEEAAGVLKYKKRKEEAIRKLDRTHDNLNRVLDITNELEVQVEPLREQSIKAKEYLENKSKLEEIEVALITYEIESLNFDYKNAKERIEVINKEIMALSTSYNGDDVKIDQQKVELIKLEKDLSLLQEQLLEITKEEEKLNGEKKLLQERSKYSATDQKVYDSISTLNEKKFKLKNDLSNIQLDLDINNKELMEVINKLNDIDKKINSIRENNNNINRELSFKNKELMEVDNKISVLDDYINSGGNLPQSVKSILNSPKLNGIHDVIGNIISSKNEYGKALEVALGASKQFIVVDNENNAKEAIEYLKDNKLGRSTFFPINVIKPKGIDFEIIEVLKNEYGYINIFSSLVEYDQEYRNIILNQLGNVIVVDNIDNANRIAKKINYRYKIVTLDGDIINVGGSITGGTVNVNRSIITDKFELERLIKSKKLIFQTIEELEKNIIDNTVMLNNIEEEYSNINRNKLSLEEVIKNKEETLNDITISYNSIVDEVRSLEHVTNSSLSKEEDRITTDYYNKLSEKNVVINSINIANKKIDNLKQVIEELEAKNKLNNSSLHTYEKELKGLEINVSKMDVRLDNYLNILSGDYEMTFEKAKENYVLKIDIDEARELVNQYKTNIKRIGMVNLDSILEYEKVSERYNFLTSQRQDLLNAKDQLLEIIDEMDTVMKEEFIKTFREIEKEFEDVFKQLFNGGKASLKLTDPDNILETGVDIIASPPGKKLTTISLLSGGEKTLTAISLLFAILNVRTVPFCLFDEVEAALDEANVDNFGRYLEHYKTKTQFLLITHKKKTMEYANTLYGITMQESGVSKLVSVKFDTNK
ncbi:MAG: AAA family ATPase [Bacilli bacterium]|nr:AAA family ATPase [Bacilli bacterium]